MSNVAHGEEMDVLLDATRDVLRAALALAANECDVTPDGQPNPNCGQRFFAIWGGSVQNSAQNRLDELYGFRVTVTVRTAASPYDRKRDGGVWKLALKAAHTIHMNYAIRTAALAANADIDFTEPPSFLSANYLGAKGADWFWADPKGDGRDPTGLAVELNFGKARHLAYPAEESED